MRQPYHGTRRKDRHDREEPHASVHVRQAADQVHGKQRAETSTEEDIFELRSCDSVMLTLRTMNVLINGTTMNPAVVSPAIRLKARRCLPFASIAHIRAPADSVLAAWRK